MMLDRNTVIKDLEKEEVHKYLGADESNGTQHAEIKEKIKKRVLHESMSNLEDRTRLCNSNRSNKYFGNTCCSI